MLGGAGLTIDTFELARTGAARDGELPVLDMPRLASLLHDADGALAWSLHARREPRPEGGADDFMRLAIDGTVSAGCVRCLGPVPVALSIERSYRLVRSEEEAERLDLEDTEFDVIAGSRRFDLAELIEDEAIMALPPVVRHEDCAIPADPAADEVAADERPNPFAVLQRLRRDEGGNLN
ncbi:MAG: hypothetical protein ABT05_07595 [Lautropia sp. SCN 66-9]|nr:MAG: hypothetical protein ABT05_07595 [Lautropia sp. SCN 66-9]